MMGRRALVSVVDDDESVATLGDALTAALRIR
jgi:hypothetical protein